MAQERILISSEWGEVTAELADNDAATSLLRMLPVTIQMRDHLRQEKTGNLPSPLKEVARQTHFSKRGRSGFGLRITLLSITVTAKSRSPASSFLDKRSVTLRF